MSADAERRARVALDVAHEQDRQREKWGEQNHDARTWALILGEEVGEVSRAILAELFGGMGYVREELVQVAAVACSWIECIDRREEAR